jgi:carboxymethylenebutenolidase
MAMFEASHVQYNIVSGYIQIVSNGQYLPAFWSHPELGGPFPGLVLLHDHWGLTAHIRSEARRFAQEGYYVIAPDLFNRQVATSLAQAQLLVEQVGAAALSYAEAALQVLKTHHNCNGKIGLIGWGLGAQLALRAAVTRDDLRALVIFYEVAGDVEPDLLRALHCPLLAIFAGQDPASPAATVDRLRGTLDESEQAHEVVVYPGVGRDFFDDSCASFDAEAATNAWQRALEFLNAHLDVPPKEIDGRGEFDPGRVY